MATEPKDADAETEALANALAQSVAEQKGEPPPTEVPAEDPAPEPEPAEPTEPTVGSSPMPTDEIAQLKAELAALKQQAQPDVSRIAEENRLLRERLDKFDAEQVSAKQAAEAAQLEQRIKAVKALRLQAKQEGDEVKALAWEDELEDLRAEKVKRDLAAQLRPQQQPVQQPSFDEQMRQRFVAEENDWLRKNNVNTQQEYRAVVASFEALRISPQNQGKHYRELWDAALTNVRGTSAQAPRAKATYAPAVEGAGQRPASPTRTKRALSSEEKRVAQGLAKYSNVTEDDYR